MAIYEKLKDKIDTTQLCLKLISLHLEKNSSLKIGLSKEQIAKLEENYESEQPKKSNKKFVGNTRSATKGNLRGGKGSKNNKRYDNIDRSQPYTNSIWG